MSRWKNLGTSRAARTAALALALAAVGVGLVVIVAGGGRAADGPFLPAQDDEVLERLPRSSSDPRSREARRLREALTVNPQDEASATRLAQLEIENARITSDPRHLGYAQAALKTWWTRNEAPPAVLTLRATIRQSRHDFLGALADLDRAVALAPDEPQTWITRSVVLSVLGRYPEAAQSCERLWRLTSPLVAEVCGSSIDGLTGKAPAAAKRLQTALSKVAEQDPVRPWATSVLAELTAWTGDRNAATQTARAALALDPEDHYTRGLLADLLMDGKRHGEVPDLLRGRESNDGLLLRLAIAQTALGKPEAQAHIQTLTARFDAARARGDALHGREEARFHLALRRDPTRALTLAVANWQVQHEPADARVLLEAAVAAGQPSAAAPALTWLRQTGFQDPVVNGLAVSLTKGGAP